MSDKQEEPETPGVLDTNVDASLTREALYELVWSEPMLKVAARFGVSSSYMARVCTLLYVPRPERGYYLAYQVVRDSITTVLKNENPGAVVDDTHRAWYRELFTPSITAGILQPADLAGYRNDQVYIRRSMHTPPGRDAVRDLMPALFDLIKEEPNPAVRVVLGHFMFVYIHPYMDGNGRIGRFLMNVMLAAGGYPWTVIPVEQRNAYMAALEAASVSNNIGPLTDFLATLVRANLEGKPGPNVPVK